MWWRFTSGVTGTVSLSTLGSSFDTVLGVYTGSSVDSLTEVGSDDDNGNGGLWSQVELEATAGTTYQIAVDGYGGATGDISLSWTGPLASTGMLRVTTSPALPAQIVIDGVPRDSWGLNWLHLPAGTYSVTGTHVEGYTDPTPQQVIVTSGATSTITLNYTRRGSLRVVTSPAVPSTVSVDGVARDDWGMWTDIAAGTHQVCFGPVMGLATPACQNVSVSAGALSTITGTFVSGAGAAASGGQLRVSISPALPAQIVIDGIPRDSWGLTWVHLPAGTYSVTGTHVEGYTDPTPQQVIVTSGATSTITLNYTRRGSLRVVTSPAVPSTVSVDGVARDDWGMWTDIAAGTHQVCFGPVMGLATPACQTINVSAGVLKTVTGTF